MLKRNSLAFGASLGAVLPVFLYIILQELFTVEHNGINTPRFDQATSLVLSMAVNLIPFTQYMKKPEYEQTGKGILLVTFIYAAVYIFIKFFREA